MTNDESILREVDQALAQDTQARTFQKNLPAIAGAALIVVVGVGGWQFWTAQRQAAAQEASAAYDEALKSAGAPEGVATLQTLSDEGGGYAALATMRLAGAHAAKGEREEALKLYRDVYESGPGSKRLKDVARVRAAWLALADGREAVLKDIGSLETDQSALGYYAREAIALAALKAGDYQSAEQMFRKAASTPGAPEGIRLRAEEFAALAGAGKAGVEFPEIEVSGKSDIDRYMENLEKAGGDLSSVLDGGSAAPIAAEEPHDETHDHSAEPESNE